MSHSLSQFADCDLMLRRNCDEWNHTRRLKSFRFNDCLTAHMSHNFWFHLQVGALGRVPLERVAWGMGSRCLLN